MKRLIIILLMLFTILACEEIYHPDLEEVDNKLVVEATLNAQLQQNTIKLYRSHGFNSENKTYPPVSGAKVYLSDNLHNRTPFIEMSNGTYLLDYKLDESQSYQLQIELDGETYESRMQAVPEMPKLDSVYADYATDITISGAANNKEDIITEHGVRVYTDINNEGQISHYRFDAQKVILYVNHYDTVIKSEGGRDMVETRPIYSWKSRYPTGIFNIAGPPAYSTQKEITKHPLEFFNLNYKRIISDTVIFTGWIYIVHQYGLNEDSYNYYKDLNNQLDAQGKIFDPVYIQANGNIKCLTNPDEVVLGNFEISSYAEARYYLMYSLIIDNLSIKRIPKDYYIPNRGALKDKKPEFWDSIYMSE
ncbi:DUF4249 domain-containing protein [Maribellus sp. CM-23]|uniref:DUF4249 domain-containing protein n=1 Tax=Maribellus sp. CM-23 TaxID=2781026 RepID=UPI001F381B20|nr:DUF4249 domain-containing protein [Maribellus sp. CM-23]MCE4562863.1 DUF4249 domain-containing protein [Maribellus sp. CM-23]